jgi:YVTN family beta-propeller protein
VIEEARFPGRQGRLLFAYLVAEQGRAVPRDELAEALWGETPPATWEKALTVLVSKLRGLLAERGIVDASVTSAFGCYRLDLPEGSWIDVLAAASATQEAEQALAAGDVDEAKAEATLAASLLRQPFLPGEEGAWVDEKRRELADVRGRALTILADACLQSGDAPEAAKWAEQAVALEPFRETGYRRLMEAHAAAGNRAEALRVYERCRRLLADELGAYPSPETESVYRGLLEAPVAQARAAPVEAPPRDATSVAEPHHERESELAPRFVSRRRVFAAAAILAAGAAIAAGVLATRGDQTNASGVPANAVGFIDADGDRVDDPVIVDAAPTSIAFGHGALWVTNAYANTVSRVDAATRTVRQTITVGSSPSGIAVGGGGVWVANHDDGTVSWINPLSNTVVREIRVGNAPLGVAVGSGSVWVTNSDDRTLSRIDAETGDVLKTIATGAVGRGIAVGPASVWVTDEATRTVVEIDAATNRVTNRGTVGSGPVGIVYGDGALWVADELDGTVSEIDPTTMAIRAAIPITGSPSALAFGDGALWVSAEFGQRVVKIDPRTRRRVAIPIGNRPKGIAAVPGGVWVAVQESGKGHQGGRLVVLADAFGSLDPGLASDTNSFTLLGAYDGLTAFRRVGGSEGTQLVPNLAVVLPLPTDAGRSYTFKVRAGIRYSDGSLLRPQDFRRALERVLALGSPWVQGSALTKVVGASGCSQGRRCDLSRGMIVNGDRLTFRLTAADPRFLLSLPPLVPVPAGTPPKDIGVKPIPSTGPYAIESYVPRRQLTLVRNAHFRSWSQAARPDGYPDEIVWRLGVPADKAVREVLDGKADVLLNSVPADRIDELATRYPSQLHLVPQRATTFVFLNTRRAPFDDIRVRRALNYAVDRRKVAALHGGPAVAQPTCQVLPPAMPGYDRYCPYTVGPESSGEWKAPDLEQARRLIAASGTKGEKIVVWTFPFFGSEARYFVSLLRRLGYRAQLKELQDLGSYFTTLNRTPSVQAGFAGWFGSLSAAELFTELDCRFTGNWARFCDARIEAQVRRLTREQASDPTAGTALAARIDREIVDRAPWVPLFTPRFADFVSKRVGNYQANTYASSSVLLDQLWVR